MSDKRSIPQPTMSPAEVGAWVRMAKSGRLARYLAEDGGEWPAALQREVERGKP